MKSSTANHRLLKCGSSVESSARKIRNYIRSVGFLFPTWGITDLMNVAAILHHSNIGLEETFLLICQGFELSNGSQERCAWLQVEGPGSASFLWRSAWLSGHHWSPVSWDLAFSPQLSLLTQHTVPRNSQVTVLRWSCPHCLFVSGMS